MNTLLLRRKDVLELLTMEDAIRSAESAYRAYSSRKVVQPPIVSVLVPEHNGELDIKSGYSIADEVIGLKVATGYPDNPRKYGLDSLYSMMCLYDAATSYPLCIMESGKLTYFRTAAAGAYAASKLARKDSKAMAIIGTGGLARMHVAATASVFALETLYVYGNMEEQRAQFVRDMAAQFPSINVINCTTAKEAVENADIVATATPSHEAIVMKEWIRPGTHINAFGCDMEGKQELDPELFRHAKVVVDSPDECMRRGETQHSIKQKIIAPDDIYAEIGEIALGEKSGRTNEDEITIFDSVGLSIQDIAIANILYKKAVSLEKGLILDFC